MSKITVTEDHLTLLARMDFDWDDECEWGAVSSDPKRPFGNSNVRGDVSELVGREVSHDEARRLTIELAGLVSLAVRTALASGVPAVGADVELPRRAARLLGWS